MAVTKATDSSLATSVGLTDEDLVAMYRLVALARSLDERMWVLNRAGRIPFVISGQGHEGAQVGITWPLKKGHDWIAPFYRSIATCLTFGMSPRDILTAQYATANDPSSGGRQMPGHYGSHEHNLVSVSSPVATQLLHAVGIALAAKLSPSWTSPWLLLPSPIVVIATWPVFRILAARAIPTAWSNWVATGDDTETRLCS